jgi:cysteinyl-tRNA synthetase
MNDDLNSPMVIAHLFDAVKTINAVHDGHASLSATDLAELKETMKVFVEDILGLQTGTIADDDTTEAYHKAIDLLLTLRVEAKVKNDWETADHIRNQLIALGFEVKDTKDGFEWKR